MKTAPRTADTLTLEGYVRHYRNAAIVRFLTVIALTGLLATVATPGFTLRFGLLQLALCGILMWAVEVAAADSDASTALRKLTVRTGLLVFLISLHACWMALVLRSAVTTPELRTETGLLIIGMLMLNALQMHMSRLGYAAAVLPSVASLALVGLDRSSKMADAHFAVAVLLFVAGVIAISWRQQTSDRTLSLARLQLQQQNAALTTLVGETEAARRQAEAANRAKSDFLAVTSHEIRTPLNAVLGLAEALRREPLSPHQADLVAGVLDGGAMLKRLLNTVLDISKIEAGKMTVEAVPFDLRRTVTTAVDVWVSTAREAGVAVRLDVDASAGEVGLVSDQGKVEQTLVNLISNAVKFTPTGGVVTVRMITTDKGASRDVRLEVCDQGPGVPEAERGRVFEVFEQTDIGRKKGGAGLGLAICASNMKLLGGRIGVDEAPGGGARFWMEFSAPRTTVAPVAEARLETDLAGISQLRVLVAEDNPANRRVLQALLGCLPLSLTLVEDGAQALEALEADRFDLVLMDVNMPVMDGRTALVRLREREAGDARVPVWMLTANVFDDDVAGYMAAGADGVLRKPIEVDELFDVITLVASLTYGAGDDGGMVELSADVEAA